MDTQETQPTTEATAQTPVAPPETPAASEGTAPPVVATPQYFTKEEAANLIAQAVQQAKETGRREMQSEKDREIASAFRRQRQLEAELSTVSSGLSELDPETREKLELRAYKQREQTQYQIEVEEAQQRAVSETINQFYVNLSEYAKEVGIDPTDRTLDWGAPNESLTVRQNRFLKSVARIQKNQTKSKEDAISKRLQDETVKMRKELGLESVDKTPSMGAVAGPIPTNMREFREYVANLSSAEYDKMAPKIKEMMDSGKIK